MVFVCLRLLVFSSCFCLRILLSLLSLLFVGSQNMKLAKYCVLLSGCVVLSLCSGLSFVFCAFMPVVRCVSVFWEFNGSRPPSSYGSRPPSYAFEGFAVGQRGGGYSGLGFSVGLRSPGPNAPRQIPLGPGPLGPWLPWALGPLGPRA